jgi:hypothetical protein
MRRLNVASSESPKTNSKPAIEISCGGPCLDHGGASADVNRTFGRLGVP